MPTETNPDKKTRKKRRVPGTETPPRVSFTLRMELASFESMTNLLRTFDGSRNDYICELIDLDLKHRERFRALNTPALDFLDQLIAKDD